MTVEFVIIWERIPYCDKTDIADMGLTTSLNDDGLTKCTHVMNLTHLSLTERSKSDKLCA